MPKFIKKRSKKSGLPPGTLVHIGEKKTEEVKIKIIDYDEMHLEEREVIIIEEELISTPHRKPCSFDAGLF